MCIRYDGLLTIYKKFLYSLKVKHPAFDWPPKSSQNKRRLPKSQCLLKKMEKVLLLRRNHLAEIIVEVG